MDTLRGRLLSLTTLGIDVALTPSGVNHLCAAGGSMRDASLPQRPVSRERWCPCVQVCVQTFLSQTSGIWLAMRLER